MKLYTGTGDTGMTSLLNETKVSKADDRIELLGTIDELSSNIGLAKVIILEDFTNVNGFFNLIFILTQFLVFIKDFRHFIFLCNPHILP